MKSKLILPMVVTGLLLSGCQDNKKQNKENSDLIITKNITTNFGSYKLRYLNAEFKDQAFPDKLLDASTEIIDFSAEGQDDNQYTFSLTVNKDATILVDIEALTNFTGDGNTDGLILWQTASSASCKAAEGNCLIEPAKATNLPVNTGLYYLDIEEPKARKSSSKSSLAITMPLAKADSSGYHRLTSQFPVAENGQWRGSLPVAHEYKIEMVANGNIQPIMTVNHHACEAIYLYDRDNHAAELLADVEAKFGQEIDEKCLFAIQDLNGKSYCVGASCAAVCPELPLEYAQNGENQFQTLVAIAIRNYPDLFNADSVQLEDLALPNWAKTFDLVLPADNFNCYYEAITVKNEVLPGTIYTINDPDFPEYEPACLYHANSDLVDLVVNNERQVIDNFENIVQLKEIQLNGKMALLGLQRKIGVQDNSDWHYYAVVLMTKDNGAEHWSYRTIYDPFDASWDSLDSDDSALHTIYNDLLNCEKVELFSDSNSFGLLCLSNYQARDNIKVTLSEQTNIFKVERNGISAIIPDSQGQPVTIKSSDDYVYTAVDTSGRECTFALIQEWKFESLRFFGTADSIYVYAKPYKSESIIPVLYHVNCEYVVTNSDENPLNPLSVSGQWLDYKDEYVVAVDDIFITEDGIVYGIDPYSAAILKGKFDPENSETVIMDTVVARYPTIDQPWALTVVGDDIYYITGNLADKLAKYDLTKNNSSIVGWAEGSKYYHEISQIAYDHQGHLLVGELMTGAIRKIEIATGKEAAPLTSYKNGYGWIRDKQSAANGENLGQIADIKVTKRGEVYVASTFRYANAGYEGDKIYGDPQSAIFKADSQGRFTRVMGKIVDDSEVECYEAADLDLLSLCINFGSAMSPLLDKDYGYVVEANFSKMVLLQDTPAIVTLDGDYSTIISVNGTKEVVNNMRIGSSVTVIDSMTDSDDEYLIYAEKYEGPIFMVKTDKKDESPMVAMVEGDVIAMTASDSQLFVVTEYYDGNHIVYFSLDSLISAYKQSNEMGGCEPFNGQDLINAGNNMGSLASLGIGQVEDIEYIPADNENGRPSLLCFTDQNYGNIRCLVNPEMMAECNELSIIVDNTLGMCQYGENLSEEAAEECKSFMERYGKCEKYYNNVEKSKQDNFSCIRPQFRTNIMTTYSYSGD